MYSFSPTKTTGLPLFAQKTLLEQIESSGGLDRFRNQDNKKDQLIKPLLDKFPNLFGGIGGYKVLVQFFLQEGQVSRTISKV